MGVRPDRCQQCHGPRAGDHGRMANERGHPTPRHQAMRDFETAGPIDPVAARVGADPRLDRRHAFGGITLVARQGPCLCEVDDPLVTIELPHDLAVAHDRRVQWIETAPVHEWCASRRDRIQMPVDWVTEGQRTVSQQVEAPLDQSCGSRDDLAPFFDGACIDHSLDAWLRKPGEEAARKCRSQGLES